MTDTAAPPTDPPHQWLPAMSSWDYDRLRQSIATHGLIAGKEPVVDENGDILDGHHRAKVCDELGIVYRPQVRGGMTPEQKWDYVFIENVPRRHLTPKERRACTKEYTRRHPELSNRQIAAVSGVDHKTVAGVRDELEACGEIPHIDQPKTRNDIKNRAETEEAKRIQAGEEDDDRTPVDAAKHNHECWADVLINYPPPADEVRSRMTLGGVFTRDAGRSDWQATPGGVIPLTSKAPTNDEEWRAMCTELGDAVYRLGQVRPLSTMDPEAQAWR